MQEAGLQARLRKRCKVRFSDQAGRSQSARSRLHGGRAESTVGRPTEFVIDGSGKLYSRRSWICSPGSSWGGPSVRQRPPGDHQGAPALNPLVVLRSGLHLWRIACSTRTVVQHEGGNCYGRDGELFSTVKSELREHFDNGEAKMELFDYIEVFYNQRRRHSSAAAFERCAGRRAWTCRPCGRKERAPTRDLENRRERFPQRVKG